MSLANSYTRSGGSDVDFYGHARRGKFTYRRRAGVPLGVPPTIEPDHIRGLSAPPIQPRWWLHATMRR